MSAVLFRDDCGASKEAISFHYDVGNRFYEAWLDPSMTYSCALWDEGISLLEAQHRKMDWHLRHANLKRGDVLLDIGCGWGGLMRRAIDVHGIRGAVGLSLSSTQIEHIKSLQYRNIDSRVESWTTHEPASPYDAIVSIGAFEHFARPDQSQESKLAGYRQFFEFCHRSLRPGGGLSLQSIVYENFRRENFSEFFATEIFPESDLPYLDEIISSSRGLFEAVVIRNDRADYAKTMRCWLEKLRSQKNALTEEFGAPRIATFEKYLSLMIVSFHTGTMNLSRIAFKRIGN